MPRASWRRRAENNVFHALFRLVRGLLRGMRILADRFVARIAAVPVASEAQAVSQRSNARDGHGGFHADLKDALAKPHTEKRPTRKADGEAPATSPFAHAGQLKDDGKRDFLEATASAGLAADPGDGADEADALPPATPRDIQGLAANDIARNRAASRSDRPDLDADRDAQPILADHKSGGVAEPALRLESPAPFAAQTPPPAPTGLEQPQQTNAAEKSSAAMDAISENASARIAPKADAKAAVSVRTVKAQRPALSIIAGNTAQSTTELAANDAASAQPADDTAEQANSVSENAKASQTNGAPPQHHATPPPSDAELAAKPMPPSPQALQPMPAPAAALAPAQPQAFALDTAAATQPQNTAADGNAVTIPDLAAVIAVRAQAGARSFEIRLDPAELGRIEVHLDLDRSKADATILVHRPETLALLVSDSRNLERALHDAGIDASNLSLNFALKGDGRQGDGGGASSRARTRSLPDAVVARSEATNASIASLNSGSSSNRLDIRV